MSLAPERQRHVESAPVLLIRNAGFGQHGLAKVKAQILEIVWPRARVQVEHKMVLAIVPSRNLRQATREVFDVALF